MQQINDCNHHKFRLFSLRLRLPAVLHRQVNTAWQSVPIRPHCSSQFSICHGVHLQWKQSDFRERCSAICFGLFQRSAQNKLNPLAVQSRMLTDGLMEVWVYTGCRKDTSQVARRLLPNKNTLCWICASLSVSKT